MARILSIVFLLLGSAFVHAQNCIPDQNIKTPGFYPKIIEAAVVDVPYKQVLQIRVFEDTTVLVGGNPVVATIDSINVLDIKGLPANFYYTCSRKNCSFIPDSTGCSTMEGTATKGQAGDYPLSIEIEVFGKVFGTVSTSRLDTIDQFTMVVEDEASIGNIVSERGMLYPNPAINHMTLLSQNLVSEIEEVICYNQLGQPVDYQLVNGQLDFGENASGLYTVRILMKNGQHLSQKILIAD